MYGTPFVLSIALFLAFAIHLPGYARAVEEVARLTPSEAPKDGGGFGRGVERLAGEPAECAPGGQDRRHGGGRQ